MTQPTTAAPGSKPTPVVAATRSSIAEGEISKAAVHQTPCDRFKTATQEIHTAVEQASRITKLIVIPLSPDQRSIHLPTYRVVYRAYLEMSLEFERAATDRMTKLLEGLPKDLADSYPAEAKSSVDCISQDLANFQIPTKLPSVAKMEIELPHDGLPAIQALAYIVRGSRKGNAAIGSIVKRNLGDEVSSSLQFLQIHTGRDVNAQFEQVKSWINASIRDQDDERKTLECIEALYGAIIKLHHGHDRALESCFAAA